MSFYPPFTKEKWEQVKTHPYFAHARERIAARAETFLTTPPPQIKFSQIHLFAETGNREIYERVHGEYMNRVETFFFMYMLTEDDKYLMPLADAVWNVCDMESWTIPAHVAEDKPLDRRRGSLDLVSTGWGATLSVVYRFAGDKLPALVKKRLENEIRVRIIDAYREHRDFHWEHVTSNWSAVCISGVLTTFALMATPEETEEQLPRMMESIRAYLSGFADDGCCQEGYSYWNYGFSYFCRFGIMLRHITDGKIDLFKEDKVHKIALFQQNVPINKKQCISFSDAGGSFAPMAWLSHFLKSEYPDVQIPAFPESPDSSAQMYVYLLENPDLAAGDVLQPKSHIYEDVQWMIYRGNYTFVCKAGHNAELHNHNDVGSFIFSKGEEATFTDPGGGEYTRQYFSSERYMYVSTHARGHSLPIINGRFQVCGKNKSTILAEAENEYYFRATGAYDDPTLTEFDRHFLCEETGVKMTDTFDFNARPTSLTERFVSLLKPEKVKDGVVKVGDTELVYDPAVYDLSFTDEELLRKGGRYETLYMTDLTVKHPAMHTEVSVFLQ